MERADALSRAGTSTRSGCSTGPGCCARPAWLRDAERLLARAADAVRGAPAAPGRGRDRAGAAPSARWSRATSDRARAAGRGRGAGLRAPRQRRVAAQGAAAGAALRARCTVGAGRTRRRPRSPAGAHGPARLAEDCRAESAASTWRGPRRAARASSAQLRAGGADDVAPPALSPAMRAADPLPSRLQTREVRALAALQPRRAAPGAAAEVRRGLAELGSYQNGFGSLDLRTASAVHGLPLARLGLELAPTQRQRRPSSSRRVERGRAISIRLARRRPAAATSAPPTCSPSCGGCEEEARGLEGDPAAGEELGRLRARARGLQRDIRARAWELEGGAGGDRPRQRPGRRGPAAARAARHGVRHLRACTAAGGRRWSRPGGRAAAASTWPAPAEVDELVQRVRADLDALAMPLLPPPLRRRRTTLARRRAAPARRPAASRRSASTGPPLVVSCSAALVLLPWSLLPSRRGLPVVVTPSATAWLRAGGRARRTARGWWRSPARGCTAPRTRRAGCARCGRAPSC